MYSFMIVSTYNALATISQHKIFLWYNSRTAFKKKKMVTLIAKKFYYSFHGIEIEIW